ncbi:hypothetical protein HanXRQr2_Chr13g0571481 [Helianthus annuus]|uniref:Uncharacterized protein n=1 Tax=Helianthus annuus TaxID=4232 RepID=A0A9K3EF27_HELAN|nr:hypothetical protein HanXRQr2_Chr13g0571481 [Helianthus annuus]
MNKSKFQVKPNKFKPTIKQISEIPKQENKSKTFHFGKKNLIITLYFQYVIWYPCRFSSQNLLQTTKLDQNTSLEIKIYCIHQSSSYLLRIPVCILLFCISEK